MTNSGSSTSGFPTNPVCRVNIAQPELRGLFVITAGERAGRVISFARQGQSLCFGRAPDCSAQFECSSMSRLHARAVWIADQYMIADAGSTNGTFVNNQRISGTTSLRTGDQVRLGPDLTMRFAIVDADEERALVLAGEANERDPVTGLFPRSYMEHALDAEIRRARRTSRPLSVMMLLLDPLRSGEQTNDASAGGEVLAGMSWTMRAGTRNGDLLGYFGDERFVVIAPATTLADAHLLADQLRGNVDSATFIRLSVPSKLTVSIGVASIACCTLQVDRVSLLFLAEQRAWLASRRRNAVVSKGGTIASSLPAPGDEVTHAGAG